MRLFKSPWAYLAWLALFINGIWHELRPHTHLSFAPWHPVFNGISFSFSDLFCICLMVVLVRLTSNHLERAALALLVLQFALSAIVDLHATGLFPIWLPSFRLVFLVLNTLLALLTAIRFIQVFREPPSPGILARSRPTHD